jgi:superfamily II DNA or RNA helicase
MRADAREWTRSVKPTSLPEWRLPLRAWQRDAFAAWNEDRPADALVVATPGAGKTRFAARLAHALLAERDVSRVIVVVPREHLKVQVARAMAGAWIQLDHRFRNADRALADDLDGAVVTYQQVAASPRVFASLARVPTLVLLDEIHHAGEEASWGAALREAFGNARYRVSLSGTPFRSDGAAIPFVRYHAGECVALRSYDYAQALADGVCRALVFPLHGGEAEWISRDGAVMRASFEEGLDRRHASERLRTALTQPGWLGDVLEKAHLRLLEARALGHADAGGLVAAMNQDHARFVAALLERRAGVKAELVVSDLDDASRRIARFSASRDAWIVAVHMVSEGVDIPRLRVGVFASNVVSELYFRQFCGRFVRTGSDPGHAREAYVYLPDDPRLRAMASTITADVRRALRVERERDVVTDALAAATREERASDAGAFASIAATAREGHTLDFGPLFNPVKYFEPTAAERAPEAEIETPLETHAERREALRRELRALVSQASNAFSVDHKLVHATLNERFGGPIATATIAGLEGRRRLVTRWLERRVYDGLR